MTKKRQTLPGRAGAAGWGLAIARLQRGAGAAVLWWGAKRSQGPRMAGPGGAAWPQGEGAQWPRRQARGGSAPGSVRKCGDQARLGRGGVSRRGWVEAALAGPTCLLLPWLAAEADGAPAREDLCGRACPFPPTPVQAARARKPQGDEQGPGVRKEELVDTPARLPWDSQDTCCVEQGEVRMAG